MNTTITLQMKQTDSDRLFQAFQETECKAPQYAAWQLRPEGCVITCYKSGKVVFQGKDAEVYAAPFQNSASPARKTVSGHVSASRAAETGQQYPQAGSDEVGTGDYFGPVCVSAVIVTEEDSRILAELGALDSKQVDDVLIRKIAPEIKKRMVHTVMFVNPAKYNQIHEHCNLNAIKAKLHNQAYRNLMAKAELPSFCMVDQFAPESLYYHYLRDEPKVVCGLHFETKAEDRYPAVGAASILARDAFLEYMDRMSEFYDMEFARGSGPNADRCAREFVRRYGREKLGEVAKLHFKNTEKL